MQGICSDGRALRAIGQSSLVPREYDHRVVPARRVVTAEVALAAQVCVVLAIMSHNILAIMSHYI